MVSIFWYTLGSRALGRTGTKVVVNFKGMYTICSKTFTCGMFVALIKAVNHLKSSFTEKLLGNKNKFSVLY